jgi:hypothetical protein
VKFQRGYILLTILVFLQVISMAGLFSLARARYILKAAYQHWLMQENGHRSQLVLADIESEVLQRQLLCKLPITTMQDIKDKPPAWWRQTGCEMIRNENEYRYVIEDLGLDVCARLKSISEQPLAADYIRITLFALPQDIKGAKILFQSVIVKAVASTKNCSMTLHYVNQGRQMLRDL